MKRNFLRKSLVVLLSAFTLFNTTTAYGATNSSEDDNWQAKVDPYILENMQ